jgi:hypothetical protein
MDTPTAPVQVPVMPEFTVLGMITVYATTTALEALLRVFDINLRFLCLLVESHFSHLKSWQVQKLIYYVSHIWHESLLLSILCKIKEVFLRALHAS